ncbi:hypothetical protein [Lysobacter sp. cf310]|uniref:hypothetical protein n=1 Tax=Lysobacter sp. cf310 TaxID=1761790 RepID=UPI0008EDBE03|nr:hypothetical protein [Lysobacter sp. cf310]SFK95035.1 hypothetical protein SAMN04487938_2591 [Lysobacter sp. cf310]
MTLTDAASADRLEAWVLAGHQRLERLIVPAFGAGKKEYRRQPSEVEPATVRRLPLVGLPRELCDLDAWLSGAPEAPSTLDPSVRLSLFFRYLACPVRYEPYSESAIHKAVPSSRGRYPLRYFFVQSIGGESRVYAYIPEFHGLQELPELVSPALQDGAAALVCIGRAWRYAEEYGEFAHVPCVLESGHAQSQAHHLARLLEIDDVADPDRELGRSFCALPLEIPLHCVGLRPRFDAAGLPSSAAKLATPRPFPEMELRFPKLDLFQRCFDAGSSPARAVAPTASCADGFARRRDVGGRGVLDLMRRRTSGNDRGLASSVLSELPAGSFASIVATWGAIRKSRPANAAGSALGLSLVWLAHEAGKAPNIHDIDGESLVARSWRGDLHDAIAKMLPYANTKYNLSALTAVLIIQADLQSAIEALGDAALREIYIAAGAAAQDFSIAATAHDMFARPAKMMREARLESELSLRGQVVYLVLCGFARSANPTMELC